MWLKAEFSTFTGLGMVVLGPQVPVTSGDLGAAGSWEMVVTASGEWAGQDGG